MNPAEKPRKILKCDLPRAGAPESCLVADSPHSGRIYPADFNHACAKADLRLAEDAYADKLFGFFPTLGVPFLKALFPRSYVDPNRDPGDAAGLARLTCLPRRPVPVYATAPDAAEVFGRAAQYNAPYHARLRALLEDAYQKHGRCVYVDCHSMPSTFRRGTLRNPYDVIIGTGYGATCDPALADTLQRQLESRGYAVGRDVRGYAGQYLVHNAADPARGRHALQVEISRALYMDEDTLALKPGFLKLKKDLAEAFAAFAQKVTPAPGPRRTGTTPNVPR